jgi:hypothetical protein
MSTTTAGGFGGGFPASLVDVALAVALLVAVAEGEVEDEDGALADEVDAVTVAEGPPTGVLSEVEGLDLSSPPQAPQMTVKQKAILSRIPTGGE